jgi:hypothetical protein
VTARRTWYDSAGEADLLWIEAALDGSPEKQLCVRFFDGDPGALC